MAYAYLVASAQRNRLGSAAICQVFRPSYALIVRGFAASSETQQGLECGRRLLAAVVPEDELIQIDLELSSAHPVVGADQPLLEVTNGAVGERNGRFCAFAEFGSKGLSPGDVFEPSFSETLKALEAIRVDGRAERDILDEEGNDCLGPEVWDHPHTDTPRRFATLFHCHQDEGRSSPLELSTASEAGLLAANPRVVYFHFAS